MIIKVSRIYFNINLIANVSSARYITQKYLNAEIKHVHVTCYMTGTHEFSSICI
jgi:hypothetical protein